MNEKPPIIIKYVDNTETDGYLRIIVNGFLQPSIRTDFKTGNDATIHIALTTLLEHIYEQAYKAGERNTKQKVKKLLDWIQSNQ